MKERGMLFSAPMVCALLDGSKTQTRRIANTGLYAIDAQIHGGETAARELAALAKHCPYGQPGDRLWVRETFVAFGRWETRYSAKKGRDEWHFIDMTLECDRAYQYAADNPDVPLAKGRGPLPGWYKRPAIHMPRRASRTAPEIVHVRVERLNDCSKTDAIAEGLHKYEHFWRDCDYPLPDVAYEPVKGWVTRYSCPVQAYQALWESINGAGSWDANPWIWVIEFKPVAP